MENKIINVTTPIVAQQMSEENIFVQAARDITVYKIGIVEHKDEFKRVPNQNYGQSPLPKRRGL